MRLALMERLRRSPLGLALAGMLLLTVLPNAVLRAVGAGDGVWRVREWMEFRADTDSWLPIGNALAHVEAGPAAGLYEKTYHQSEFQFIYPPTSLVLFSALRRAGLADWTDFRRNDIASWFLIPLSGAMVAALVLRLARPPGGGPPGIATGRWQAAGLAAAAALSVAAYYPLVKGYTLGQIQTLISALMILALLAWTLGARFLAGVALALGCLIKPQVAPVFLWALLRRERALLAGGIATGGLFAVLSLAAYGWQVHLEYLDLMAFLSRRGESYHSSFAINGLLNRMFFLGPNLEWDGTHASIVYNPWVHLATALSSAALILAALFWRRPRPVPAAGTASLLDLCLILVTLTLASPVAYEQHFGYTIAVLWICFAAMTRAGLLRARFLVPLAIAYGLLANVFFWPLSLLADTYLNFLQSYMLYGALALLWLLYGLRAACDDRPAAAGR